MRKLQLGQNDLIRYPKLKLGLPDLIKVKLDSFEVHGFTLHVLPPGMYPACAMSKMFKLGPIDLIN